MSTQIKVKCIDQSLTLVSTPLVASGGLNEDTVTFEFCSKWTGFSKTAVFYRNKEDVYYSLIDDDNTCYIPQEVLQEDGTLYFGVFGSNDSGVTRTSEILRYKVVQGAITKDIKPSDPTPDIYQQLLAKWQDIKDGEVKFTQDITKQQNDFEANINNKVQKVTDDEKAFEEKITAQQENYENDLSSQWSTYKTDLTNQQNTFETNITKKENDFETSTTNKLNTYENEVEDIASSAVTKAQISVEITLTTTWTLDSTNGYYTQNVEVDGIKSTDMPTLDVKFTGDSDNMKAINKEWSKVLSAETYEDGIKFYAKSATTKELTVIVKGALSKVNISEMTKEQAIKYFSGTFVNIDNIVDNLTSTDTDKPLSAKQGKLLDEKITSNVSSLNSKITDVSTKETTFEANINTEMSTFKSDVDTQIAKKLSNVYRVCGSVANYEALPTNAEVGDVYNLLDNGTNYVWTGTEWDSLAGIVDLSAYLKTADASNTYATKTALSATNTNVANNATAITNEKSARATADTTLQANIDKKANQSDLTITNTNLTNEIANRKSADTTLQTNIDNETNARTSADEALQTNIDKKANSADLSKVATSGSYSDLSNKPTIPTVGNGTITITQNGTTKGSFTTNQTSNITIALTDNNTTYSNATTSTAGLMSASDKSKLDGIESNANNYSLPTATSNVLGGVKIGSNITNTSGVLSLTKANVTSALGYTPVATDTKYNVATQSENGLMSSTDKVKLDGVATGANKTTVDTALSSTSTNPVQNKVINTALNNKQNTLVSGNNIKTINGASLLGSGDIELATKTYVNEQIGTVINSEY